MFKEQFQLFLDKSLQVSPRDHLMILYDESLFNIFDDMVEAVLSTGASTTYVHLPKRYQEEIMNNHIQEKESEENVALPRGLAVCITESTVIINFLDSNPKTTKIRTTILEEVRDKGSKYAHCPGFSKEHLEILMRTNFEEIYEHSELMAWTLGQCEKLSLVTTDHKGYDHVLTMDMDGWENEPLMDSGIIFEDSWGNTPPGETFCCPRHETVNGSVCINGSLPKIVFAEGEECILEFKQGKLIDWKTNNTACEEFFKNLEIDGKKRKDVHWDSFAELGIGLNTNIKNLSGNQLFDEKMAGTIHIAIGMNAPFGHSLKSDIHIDMVIRNPKLFVDEKLVISEGEIHVDEIWEWRKGFRAQATFLKPDDLIFIDKAKLNISDTMIQRRLSSGGRVDYVNISKKMNDAFCLKLETSIKENEVKYYLGELFDIGTAQEEKDRVRYLIELLIHYRVISKINK